MANMNQKNGAIKARNPLSGNAGASFAKTEVSESILWIEEDMYDGTKSAPSQMTGDVSMLKVKPAAGGPGGPGSIEDMMMERPKPSVVELGGLSVKSNVERINGIVVKSGLNEYVVSDSEIKLENYGCSDFTSRGAGAMVYDDGQLTLKNVKIDVSGGGRCATIATIGGTLKAYDCQFSAHGGQQPPGYVPVIGPGMMEPPYPLGLEGNARTHLTMDNSRSFFYNCDFYAAGWGAISTDASGGCTYLEANDSRIVVSGNGYGTYVDNGCHNVFNRCDFVVGNMLAIQDGNSSITLSDSTARCQRNAFVLHGGLAPWIDVGIIEIHGGKIEAEESVFLCKSTNVDIYAVGARLTAKNGGLIKTIVTDDEIYYMRRAKGPDAYGIQATFERMDLTGDVLHEDSECKLRFSMVDTKLTGAITGGACLFMYGDSFWKAAADSSVELMGDINVECIDAASGVTIHAIAGEGCALSGEYALASGGKLIVA